LEVFLIVQFRFTVLIYHYPQTVRTRYPETVQTIVVLNLREPYYTLSAMVMKIVPPGTRDKVVFALSLSDLYRYVDPSEVPNKYGGEKPNSFLESPDEKLMMHIIIKARQRVSKQ